MNHSFARLPRCVHWFAETVIGLTTPLNFADSAQMSICTIVGGKIFFSPTSGYPQPDESLFL